MKMVFEMEVNLDYMMVDEKVLLSESMMEKTKEHWMGF
jgi:hypothetical protein